MNWELPPGWWWKPLAESLHPVRAQVQADSIHDDWLYLGLEHVQSGTGNYTGVDAGTAGIRSNKFLFEPGDVLYGKLRPNLRKCVVAEHAGVCSTDLVPLRPTDPDAAHFLALQLRSEPFTQSVMRMIGGANLPRVNVKDLFTLGLPAPPEAEQSRLNAVARSVATLREKQRALESSVAATELAATASVLGFVSEPLSDGLKAVHDS